MAKAVILFENDETARAFDMADCYSGVHKLRWNSVFKSTFFWLNTTNEKETKYNPHRLLNLPELFSPYWFVIYDDSNTEFKKWLSMKRLADAINFLALDINQTNKFFKIRKVMDKVEEDFIDRFGTAYQDAQHVLQEYKNIRDKLRINRDAYSAEMDSLSMPYERGRFLTANFKENEIDIARINIKIGEQNCRIQSYEEQLRLMIISQISKLKLGRI